ncbi:tetratricopeptide repeat protein [Streptomyces olivochromogenes]|uniref:tetratricopeptide repeat protein n=1 Tax=Streptomyces olivochromogenes TaxID=1963 RepID=UPI00131E45C7|nr:tetratricopeptide repeat protein [Streptomyces olivochromogenes]
MFTPLLQSGVDRLKSRSEKINADEDAQIETLRGLGGENRSLPLVSEINNRALFGIHPAIPLPAEEASSISPELPIYVPRDIDADLHTGIRSKSEIGGFFLLVGRAASGKTRCAYEAINAVLPEWRLCMPADAKALSSLVTSEFDLSHTVVWLDEIQKFLGPEQLQAEVIRGILMNRNAPTILIGTIWPENYNHLRAPLAETEEEDPNRNARDILNLASRFDISTFSFKELDRARQIAEIDPRIAEVIHRGPSASVTELLAAAPELIHRWIQGENEFGRLLITAAVSARACGIGEEIPVGTLRDIAVALMNGRLRAMASDSWFEEAVHWASRPVRGASSPLAPHSKIIGAVDSYTVSDVLTQYANESAPQRTRSVSDEIWEITLRDTNHTSTLISIFTAAEAAGNTSIAERAATRAAEAGSNHAIWLLSLFLEKLGRNEEALAWILRGAERRDVTSMALAGLQLFKTDRREESEYWLRQAAAAGDANAMGGLGVVLMQRNQFEEALVWTRRSAEKGSFVSMEVLGDLLAQRGERGEATEWFRRAVQHGNRISAQAHLGIQLMGDEETLEEAEGLLRRAAEAGEVRGMVGYGMLLSQRDHESAEARHFLTLAVEAGDEHGMMALGILHAERGETSNAIHLYERASQSNQKAVRNLAIGELMKLLRAQGRDEEAARWELQLDALNGAGADE